MVPLEQGRSWSWEEHKKQAYKSSPHHQSTPRSSRRDPASTSQVPRPQEADCESSLGGGHATPYRIAIIPKEESSLDFGLLATSRLYYHLTEVTTVP